MTDPDEAKRVRLIDLVVCGECSLQLSRNKNAIAAMHFPTGTVHPHKLATSFLRAALQTQRCKLFSWAPVQAFKPQVDHWELEVIGRGSVRAREVVVCTNAHTSWLFKGTEIDDQYVAFASFQPVKGGLYSSQSMPVPGVVCAGYAHSTVVGERRVSTHYCHGGRLL